MIQRMFIKLTLFLSAAPVGVVQSSSNGFRFNTLIECLRCNKYYTMSSLVQVFSHSFFQTTIAEYRDILSVLFCISEIGHAVGCIFRW